MPGRNYNEAYAQLEQSLRRSDIPDNAQDIFGSNLMRSITGVSHGNSKPSSLREFGSRNPSLPDRLVRDSNPTYKIPNRTSSLNHTTPIAHKLPIGSTFRDERYRLQVTSSSNSRNQTSTANLRPSQVHIRSGLSPAPSPFAESFATALEDQVSDSVNGSGIELPLDGVDDEYMSHSRRHRKHFGLKNMGWGIENVGSEHDSGINAIDLDPSEVPFFEAFDQEWNSGSLNAKSRRKRRKRSSQSGLTFLDDKKSEEKPTAYDDTQPESPSPGSSWLNTASLERMSEEMARRSTLTSPETVPNGFRSETPVSVPSPAGKSSKKFKRCSDESSTTVEATVVDMSPQSNRTLRRKEKTEKLRERSETHTGLGLNFESGEDVSRSQMQTPGLTFSSVDRESRASRESSPGAPTKMHGILPFDKPRPTKSLVNKLPSGLRQTFPAQPQRSKTVGSSDGRNFRTYQAQRQLFNWHNDMDGTADDLLGSAPELAMQIPVRALDVPRGPSPHDKITTPPAVQQYTRELLGPPRFSVSSNHTRDRRSPGGSLTDSIPRISVDSSHPAEVIQATAVSIQHHRNNSLLVVQHPAAFAELQRGSDCSRVTEEDILPTPTKAKVTDDHVDLFTTNRPVTTVDSPLQNPRKPPDPPAVKVVPPSPSTSSQPREIEITSHQPELVRAPSRRRRMMKNARRFSDSILNPMKNVANREGTRGRPPKSEASSPTSGAAFVMQTKESPDEVAPTSPAPSPTVERGIITPGSGKLRVVNPDVEIPSVDDDEENAVDDSEDHIELDNEVYLQGEPANASTPLVDIGPTDEPTTPPPQQQSLKQTFPPSAAKTGSLGRANTLRNLFRRKTSTDEESIHDQLPSRKSSLRGAVKRSGSVQSSSFTSLSRSLSARLRTKMTDRHERREEKERSERREKVRNSIGPRFYVDQNDTGYGTGLPERPHTSIEQATAA